MCGGGGGGSGEGYEATQMSTEKGWRGRVCVCGGGGGGRSGEG